MNIATNIGRLHSFGWVQNPSNFDNLQKVVSIFNPHSSHYQLLRDSLVDTLIPLDQIKNNLHEKLSNGIALFTYEELVGTKQDIHGNTNVSRKDAVADSLIQVSIESQAKNTRGKRWTDNWTASGYLSWALSLHFVDIDHETGFYHITDQGMEFSEADDTHMKRILRDALLAYPPASRVLDILAHADRAVTKFYIGERLGFKGESGFTSYDERLMIKWVEYESSKSERTKIKQSVEGTADKYARMICKWLEKLGLVESSRDEIEKNSEKISLFKRYRITGAGLHALRQSRGSSKNKQVQKYVAWEFLGTKVQNVNYVRTRRAMILNFLKKSQSKRALLEHLTDYGFTDLDTILDKDIEGLNAIGIRIISESDRYILVDDINEIYIPNIGVTDNLHDIELEQEKSKLISETNLPLKYYELLDIAYDGSRNRDYEILATDLFINVCGFQGTVLGGARKPDAVIFTDEYGVIVDTKAYSNGYPKNLQQEDEMVRYIEDNQKRDADRNNTRWWENFDPFVSTFYYLWVSSTFINKFDEQLVSTYKRTSTHGGAIGVVALLSFASLIRESKLTLQDFANDMQDVVLNYSV